MRVPRTLWLYVAREVLLYSLIGFAAVSVVFIGQNLLRFLSDFLLIGVSGSDVLSIVKCVVIGVLAYTIPISFLFGALAAIGRMASDVEITAMRTSGVGVRELLVPVFAIGLMVSCLTWYIALDVEHRAKRELRGVLVSITLSGTIIEPQKFTQVKERIFYVDHRDRQNRLQGVFIADQSDPERPLLIFAEQGDLVLEPESQRVRILLRNGDIHFERADPSWEGNPSRMSFETFEYSFARRTAREASRNLLRPKDMTMEELRGVIARVREGKPIGAMLKQRVEDYQVELHRRYALPVAPMIFALLAVPLSLGRGRGARAWGALLCGLLVGLYYVILSFCQYAALQGWIPPSLALWLPNLVFAGAALQLLARARRLPGV
jgi:lipopolysaccharide export system permease protein